MAQAAREVAARRPRALCVGHSGSTGANPVSLRLFAAVALVGAGLLTALLFYVTSFIAGVR